MGSVADGGSQTKSLANVRSSASDQESTDLVQTLDPLGDVFRGPILVLKCLVWAPAVQWSHSHLGIRSSQVSVVDRFASWTVWRVRGQREKLASVLGVGSVVEGEKEWSREEQINVSSLHRTSRGSLFLLLRLFTSKWY